MLGELDIRAVDLRLVEVRGRSTPVSRLSGNSRVLGRGSREHVKCRDCDWDVLVGWCRRFTASGEPFDPLGVLRVLGTRPVTVRIDLDSPGQGSTTTSTSKPSEFSTYSSVCPSLPAWGGT